MSSAQRGVTAVAGVNNNNNNVNNDNNSSTNKSSRRNNSSGVRVSMGSTKDSNANVNNSNSQDSMSAQTATPIVTIYVTVEQPQRATIMRGIKTLLKRFDVSVQNGGSRERARVDVSAREEASVRALLLSEGYGIDTRNARPSAVNASAGEVAPGVAATQHHTVVAEEAPNLVSSSTSTTAPHSGTNSAATSSAAEVPVVAANSSKRRTAGEKETSKSTTVPQPNSVVTSSVDGSKRTAAGEKEASKSSTAPQHTSPVTSEKEAPNVATSTKSATGPSASSTAAAPRVSLQVQSTQPQPVHIMSRIKSLLDQFDVTVRDGGKREKVKLTVLAEEEAAVRKVLLFHSFRLSPASPLVDGGKMKPAVSAAHASSKAATSKAATTINEQGAVSQAARTTSNENSVASSSNVSSTSKDGTVNKAAPPTVDVAATSKGTSTARKDAVSASKAGKDGNTVASSEDVAADKASSSAISSSADLNNSAARRSSERATSVKADATPSAGGERLTLDVSTSQPQPVRIMLRVMNVLQSFQATVRDGGKRERATVTIAAQHEAAVREILVAEGFDVVRSSGAVNSAGNSSRSAKNPSKRPIASTRSSDAASKTGSAQTSATESGAPAPLPYDAAKSAREQLELEKVEEAKRVVSATAQDESLAAASLSPRAIINRKKNTLLDEFAKVLLPPPLWFLLLTKRNVCFLLFCSFVFALFVC